MSTITKVAALPDGTLFEVPSCKNTLKRLRVLRVSPCSTLVKGLRRDSILDPWKPFSYPISNETNVSTDFQVRVDNKGDKDVEVESIDIDKTKKINKEIKQEVVVREHKEFKETKETVETKDKESKKPTGAKRGKQPANLVKLGDLPINKPFTSHEISKRLGVENYHVTNFLVKQGLEGNVQIKEKGVRGRYGKPTIYIRTK